MTNREFYDAIIKTVEDNEIRAHAENAIAKMDETNAKRSAKNAEKAAANKAFAAEIVEMLTDVPMTATEIAAIKGVSPQKVSSALARSGLSFKKVDVKIDKTKRKAYVRG